MAVRTGEASQPEVATWQRPRPVVTAPVAYPVVIERATNGCSCATGSGFEQKIKENPMFFVLGALLVGYLLAKH